MGKTKYTDEEMLTILRKIYDDKGDVKCEYFKAKNGLPCYGSYIERFRSWNNAKIKVNIPTEARREEKITKEILIQEFKEYVILNKGIVPNLHQLGDSGKYKSYRSIYKYFTNYGDFVRACGFNNNTNENGQYNKEFLISEVQRFVIEFNRIPLQIDFEKLEGYPSRKTFQNHFDTFNECVKIAGFTPMNKSFKERKISYKSKDYRKFLLSELDRFIKEYGHTPTIEEIENIGKFPNRYEYEQVFGGWNNALIEAKIPLNSILQHKDSFLESEFRRFVGENGRVPVLAEFNKSQYPSFWCYQNRFGSWNNAVMAYGYEINDANRKYYMDNGEICASSYEYIISTWLQERNIKYDRDVLYVQIDKFGYKGKMDCDYKIYYNNKIWFVEMAGFLSGKIFEKYSDAEKNYFFKLMYKKKLLRRSELNYIVIEPCDIKGKDFDEVFSKMLND